VAFLEGVDLALSGVLGLLVMAVSEDSCEEVLGAVTAPSIYQAFTQLSTT